MANSYYPDTDPIGNCKPCTGSDVEVVGSLCL